MKHLLLQVSSWETATSFLHDKSPSFDRLGGDKRDRTADLLNAIQTLSQLSYTPMNVYRISDFSHFVKMNFCTLRRRVNFFKIIKTGVER